MTISFFFRTSFKIRFVLMNKTYIELIHIHSLFSGVAYVVAFRVWLKTVSAYLL